MAEDKFIDIEKLIASKNEKVLKWTPRFVISYLKRILHQKEINDFIIEHKDKKNHEWCQEVVNYFKIKVEVHGLENLPKTGKVVIAMNHPLGGMDAMILVSALKDHRPDLMFIVNDLLMNLEAMREMFVGVDKHRKKKNPSSTRQQIEELFQSDKAVCIFPAGLVSRRKKKNVKDLVWKKTFVMYSRKYDRTVVPIYIDGELSNFFYRLANFRKAIGIKANIEMLYLSNELFKQRDKTLRFVVGKPIEKEFINSDTNDHDVAQAIKERVYDLKNQLLHGKNN